MTFEHYMLTRFNVGLYGRKQKMRSKKKIDPDRWMAERLDLFKKITVPSIKAQTNQKFTWFIVVDHKSPVAHSMAIKNAVDDMGNAEVLLGENFRKAVKERIGIPSVPTMITTRIDNDDAIHKDFIDTVQKWYNYKGKTGVLIFPTGWICNLEKKKLFHARYMKNPFLTLIEKCDKKVRTILFRRHTDAVNHYKLHKLKLDHAWFMNVHRSNLANHCFGACTDFSRLVLEDYGL